MSTSFSLFHEKSERIQTPRASAAPFAEGVVSKRLSIVVVGKPDYMPRIVFVLTAYVPT